MANLHISKLSMIVCYTEYDEPHTLLVLVEEELVVIDLQNDNWHTNRIPYLCSLHSSAITCAQHVTNVPEALWNKIVDVGETQFTNTSNRVGSL